LFSFDTFFIIKVLYTYLSMGSHLHVCMFSACVSCVVGDLSSLPSLWSIYHWWRWRLWDIKWPKHWRFGRPNRTGL